MDTARLTQSPRWAGWPRWVAVPGVLLAAALGLWLLVGGRSEAETSRGPSAASQARFAEQVGVRVVRVAVTARGGLVDLRYQVLDADKALVVHELAPALVDEKTGGMVDTLFMGHRHGDKPKAGLSYPLLFVNRGGLIEPGRAVTVRLGGQSLQHVVAQ